MEGDKNRGLSNFIKHNKKYAEKPVTHAINYVMDIINKDNSSINHVYDAISQGNNLCYVFAAKSNLIINSTLDGVTYEYPLMDLLTGTPEKLGGQTNVLTRLREIMQNFDDRILVDVLQIDAMCVIEYSWPADIE